MISSFTSRIYPMLTFNDFVILIPLLTACAFVTYTVGQIGDAIHSYIEE